jgi:hypothetical protein
VHGYATERRPGSSIMTFSPGNLARKLMELDDDTILRSYEEDLAEVLPGFGGTVVESEVNRWPIGSPYCFPGRAALQRTLTRNAGRVFLAGDYLGTSYTETAVHTGLKAAQEVQSLLATDRQHASNRPRGAVRQLIWVGSPRPPSSNYPCSREVPETNHDHAHRRTHRPVDPVYPGRTDRHRHIASPG